MCREASFVIVKGPKAFWSKATDRHSDIRREFGLPENSPGRCFSVQVEIVPPEGADGRPDFERPLKEWVFATDQGADEGLPEWWHAEEAEAEARLELEKWAAVRLVRAGEVRRSVRRGEYVSAVLNGGEIDSVEGGAVGTVMPGGTVWNLRRGGLISLVEGRVDSADTEATIVAVGEGGKVGTLYGLASEVRGTVDRSHGRIRALYGRVNWVAGGIVEYAYAGSSIGEVEGTATIRYAENGVKIPLIWGSAVVRQRDPECELSGDAVLICGSRKPVTAGKGGNPVRVWTTGRGTVKTEAIK